ncbi:MAG: hypothetical protein J6B79_00385 [Clostridia bacterium]|nr:hypothetical protein [Clostridia bacterium]
MNYYLGIDGGGSKTEFVLCDGKGNVLKKLIKGGSNPNDIGVDNCEKLLRDGVNEITGGGHQNLFIYAGISGAGVGNNMEIIMNGLAPLCKKVEVQADLHGAMEYSLKDNDGIMVVCGTGISCALKQGETIKGVGGYGYLFEDGGSGYAYGRDAIKAVLHYEDGYGKNSTLVLAVKSKTKGDVRPHLAELLSRGKAYIASFAPFVFDGYNKKDEVCVKIVNDNIAQTIALIENAILVYGKRPCTLAFVGGITKQAFFRKAIEEKFSDCKTIFSALAPVYGAAVKAVKLNEKIDENFENNFTRSYPDA